MYQRSITSVTYSFRVTRVEAAYKVKYRTCVNHQQFLRLNIYNIIVNLHLHNVQLTDLQTNISSCTTYSTVDLYSVQLTYKYIQLYYIQYS